MHLRELRLCLLTSPGFSLYVRTVVTSLHLDKLSNARRIKCFKDDLNINHWLEKWNLTYYNCLESLKHKDNVYFICYEELCNSKEYWLDILTILDVQEAL